MEGQEMPMEGQAAAPAEGAGGGDAQFAELIGSVSDGLAMITDIVNSSGASPDVAKQLEQLNSQFQQIMDGAMGGGQGAGAEAAGGMASPEAAGAKTAPAMR